MIYIRPRRWTSRFVWKDSLHEDRRFLFCLAVPLWLGVLFGALLGTFSVSVCPENSLVYALFPHNTDVKFSVLLLRTFIYLFFAALFSTSWLGIVLFSPLAFVRGMTLGYSSAYLLTERDLVSSLLAFASVAVPGLMGVSAFLIAAHDCLSFALRLLPRGRRTHALDGNVFSFSRLILVLFLSLAELAYCHFALPFLTRLF